MVPAYSLNLRAAYSDICLGLSKDYWMDDELCKECYDCKSVFTAWRRKHHCRICGKFTSSPLPVVLGSRTSNRRPSVLFAMRVKHYQRLSLRSRWHDPSV